MGDFSGPKKSKRRWIFQWIFFLNNFWDICLPKKFVFNGRFTWCFGKGVVKKLSIFFP